jgi:predicted dienelactone hydrolase
MAALASRGYVVASLDFPLTGLRTQGQHDLGDVHNQPGDVRFVVGSLIGLSRTPGTWLEGGVRRQRIGAVGLSLGGLTTLLVTYHPTLRDRRIRAALPIAPSACFLGARFYRTARRPLLVLQGDQDLIVPLETNGALVYQRSRSPRDLVTLVAGTHTAFSGAVTYPSPTSYDTLGCAAIQSAGLSGDPTTGLGGAEAGIDSSACTLPCQSPPPTNPPMQAARQHEITQAVVAAFFDATLKHSRAARCFLRGGLASENADLAVAAHRRGISP